MSPDSDQRMIEGWTSGGKEAIIAVVVIVLLQPFASIKHMQTFTSANGFAKIKLQRHNTGTFMFLARLQNIGSKLSTLLLIWLIWKDFSLTKHCSNTVRT